MPLIKMKDVLDYCMYNKPFFLLILFLFCILDYVANMGESTNLIIIFFSLLCNVIIDGYGMTIARDRMNNGVRLPKILINDVFVLGIKSIIISFIYFGIQGGILYCIGYQFNLFEFDLESMLMELPYTYLLFLHNPVNTLIFIVVSAVVFYITIFFIEIALARLADTGSIVSAFNLIGIKKDIDTIGWRHYAKEYTLMIFVIVIFLSATRLVIPNGILNYIWNGLLYLLAFVTQFLGIGKIYSEVKENESV